MVSCASLDEVSEEVGRTGLDELHIDGAVEL